MISSTGMCGIFFTQTLIIEKISVAKSIWRIPSLKYFIRIWEDLEGVCVSSACATKAKYAAIF